MFLFSGLYKLSMANHFPFGNNLALNQSRNQCKKYIITCCNLNRCKMQPILLSLVSLPFLQSVDFSSNDLSDDCFVEIVEMLSKIPVLKKLVAVNNKIGPQGAQHFATVLHKHKSLEYFDLRLNFVLDSGATELFKAAECHLSLRTITLASNKISSLSGPSLCNLIATNKFIQEIDLSCNNFGESTGIALVEALQKNETLQRLDLKMNHIAAEEDEKISQKLTINRKIQRTKLKLNVKV